MFASYVIYSIKQTSPKTHRRVDRLLVMLFIVLSKHSSLGLTPSICLLVMLFIVLSKLNKCGIIFSFCLLVMLFIVLSKP